MRPACVVRLPDFLSGARHDTPMVRLTSQEHDNCSEWSRKSSHASHISVSLMRETMVEMAKRQAPVHIGAKQPDEDDEISLHGSDFSSSARAAAREDSSSLRSM